MTSNKATINKNSKQNGFSLISVIVSIGLAGLLALIGAQYSGQIMTSFKIVDFQKDRNALMRTITADLSCSRTFKNLNSCPSGTSIVLRDIQGNNIAKEFKNEEGKDKWKVNAKCQDWGVEVIATYKEPMPKELDHYNNKEINPFVGAGFCATFVSNSKLRTMKQIRKPLAKINRICESALSKPGAKGNQKARIWEGEVECPENYYLLGGGVNCNGVGALLNSEPLSNNNGKPNKWSGACCLDPSSINQNKKPEVVANCRIDFD